MGYTTIKNSIVFNCKECLNTRSIETKMPHDHFATNNVDNEALQHLESCKSNAVALHFDNATSTCPGRFSIFFIKMSLTLICS